MFKSLFERGLEMVGSTLSSEPRPRWSERDAELELFGLSPTYDATLAILLPVEFPPDVELDEVATAAGPVEVEEDEAGRSQLRLRFAADRVLTNAVLVDLLLANAPQFRIDAWTQPTRDAICTLAEGFCEQQQ